MKRFTLIFFFAFSLLAQAEAPKSMQETQLLDPFLKDLVLSKEEKETGNDKSALFNLQLNMQEEVEKKEEGKTKKEMVPVRWNSDAYVLKDGGVAIHVDSKNNIATKGKTRKLYAQMDGRVFYCPELDNPTAASLVRCKHRYLDMENPNDAVVLRDLGFSILSRTGKSGFPLYSYPSARQFLAHYFHVPQDALAGAARAALKKEKVEHSSNSGQEAAAGHSEDNSHSDLVDALLHPDQWKSQSCGPKGCTYKKRKDKSSAISSLGGDDSSLVIPNQEAKTKSIVIPKKDEALKMLLETPQEGDRNIAVVKEQPVSEVAKLEGSGAAAFDEYLSGLKQEGKKLAFVVVGDASVCPPCKRLEPVLPGFQKELKDAQVVKWLTGSAAGKFNPSLIPTIYVVNVETGEKMSEFVAADYPQSRLMEKYNEAISQLPK